MKHIFILALISSTIACSRPAPAVNETVILQQITAFDHAYKTGDITTLNAMVSSNYLHTNPSGNVVSREVWLNWNSGRAESIASGELVIDKYETSDLDINIYGTDVALVSGINTSSGTNNGEAFETKVRFTHAWVLENDTWKRAAFHDSYLDKN